jgi:GntR family transcriptional repressor for pyruvate dehydrogenase complex
MKSQVKRVEKTRLSDQIIKQILSLIEKGKLKIGDKLPSESILTRQFGVGRSSLREAMGALSLMGVVSIQPGQGTYVTATPEKPLENIFDWNTLRRQDRVRELVEARIILEEAIVGFAVEKARDEDIAELRNNLAYQKSVMTNRKKYIKADWSFHMALAKASHNEVLARFFLDLQQPSIAWMERQTPLRGDRLMNSSTEQHAEILKAIEAKDADKAKLAIRQHLESAGWVVS